MPKYKQKLKKDAKDTMIVDTGNRNRCYRDLNGSPVSK